MSTAYGINGYILGGKTITQGIYLLKETEYAPALAPRRAVVEIPQVHYALPLWDDPLSEITLGLKVRVSGTDAASLRGYWNTLTGLLGMGTNRPVKLTRHRGAHVEGADGQLVSSTSPDFSCARSTADVQLVFNIPGGSWRSVDPVDQYFETGTGQEVATAKESTRPIADALIRVPGTVSMVSLTDTISGTGIQWTQDSLSVPGDGFLLIDVAAMQAAIVTEDTWDLSTGTPASGTLVFTGYGPLTLTSRRWGPAAETVTSLDVTVNGSSGPVTVRSKTAVV